ncbi:MAG: hypothetical protein PGN07_10020 [Aeromicrobium erythreum]
MSDGTDETPETEPDGGRAGSVALVVVASLVWIVHLLVGLLTGLLAPLAFLCTSTSEVLATVITSAYVMTTVVLVTGVLVALVVNRGSGQRALAWAAGALLLQGLLFAIVVSIGSSGQVGC